MATDIEIEYALMASNVYGASPLVRDPNNTLSAPDGWSQIGQVIDINYTDSAFATGFMARAYRSGNDIVISYAGTTDEDGGAWQDWLYGNLPGGTGVVLPPQVMKAAKFYLDMKAANPGANISFTGHSLGGGLASLMAVFFDRPAVIFDPAPFKKTADSETTVTALKMGLAAAGYSDPALDSYVSGVWVPGEPVVVPSPSRLERQQQVVNVTLSGEILSLAPEGLLAVLGFIPLVPAGVGWIEGTRILIEPKAQASEDWRWGSDVASIPNPIDLHAMSLLTGFLLSPAFLEAVRQEPLVLSEIFKKDGIYPNEPKKAKRNFLDLMVQRQYRGDGTLDKFASEVMQLGAGATSNTKVREALITSIMEGLYEQTQTRSLDSVGIPVESVFDAQQGGISVDFQKFMVDPSTSEARSRLLRTLRDYVSTSDQADWLSSYSSAERVTVANQDSGLSATLDGEKSDVIIGSNSDDSLSGGDGFDYLYGDQGADTLIGGNGYDTLIGGQGDDRMEGGAGYDLYIIEGNDRIFDSDNRGSIRTKDGRSIAGLIQKHTDGSYTFINDSSISVTGGANLTLTLADGSSLVIENFQNDELGLHITADTIASPSTRTILGDLAPIDSDPSSPGVQFQYDDLGNVVTDPNQTEADRADILYDSTGNDIIEAKGGDDYVEAFRGGDDKIDGGAGSDILRSGAGNDIVIAGVGADIATGDAGNDRLYANGEITLDSAIEIGETQSGGNVKGDWLDGGDDRDIVIGGNDKDLLLGGGNADVLVGGGGDDVIRGDAYTLTTTRDWTLTRTTEQRGDETIYTTVLNNATINETTLGGDDVIYGGAGNDWLFGGVGDDFIDGGADNDVLLGEAGNDILYGKTGDDMLTGDKPDDGTVDGLAGALHGSDFIDGGDGNDQIWGNGRADTLLGGAGNDTLYGDDSVTLIQYHGDDYLDGEDGNDVLLGQGGSDTLFGGAGDDVLIGDGDGMNAGTPGNDYLDGEDGNDTLIADGGDDQLFGGSGNDTLSAGDGADYLDGESGNDQLLGGDGNDQLFGGDGNDKLIGDGDGTTPGNPGDDYLDGEAGDDILLGYGGNDTLYGDAGRDELQGGDGNDTLDGGAENDRLFGGDGDDVLDGGDGNDVMTGDAGNDTLYGAAGSDQLFGQAGQDNLSGGNGNDELQGGDDADTLFGGAGDDLLLGQAGNDTLNGDDGNDQISGGDGDDVLSGGLGDDILAGNAGNDTLTGDDGSDELQGWDGNDTLYGGAGSDRLYGGAGNDILDGGAGNDVLYGEAGNDTYRFGRGSGQDTIVNFDTGSPKTDVLLFNADVAVSDVTATKAGYDLILSIKNTDDQVRVVNYFALGSGYALEQIKFADGTLWTASTVPVNLAGGVGSDSLNGTVNPDVLVATVGRDVLQGGYGADTYVVSPGSGATRLVDTGYASDIDTVQFTAGINAADVIAQRSGDDLVLTLANTPDAVTLQSYFANDGAGPNAIERIAFADGTVWDYAAVRPMSFQGTAGADTLIGYATADMLDGKAGNDILSGGAGDDTYVFGRGYGQDAIASETNNTGLLDTIVLTPDVSPADVTLTRDNADLILTINGTSDQLRVYSYAYDFTGAGPAGTIEQIRFADGTTWDQATINAQLLVATLGDDVVQGFSGNDTINGRDGNDILYGRAGNDVLDGSAGDDQLSGSDGDDVLRGGTGNDGLDGGNGNDIYYFNLGDGMDSISESSGFDTLILGPGILPGQVTVGQDGYGYRALIINGTTDQLEIGNPSADSYATYRVDQIQFADGTIWDYATIQSKALFATDNADVLNGTLRNDSLFGRGGNDALYGNLGNDMIDGGAGNDTMLGGLGDDTYVVDAGADIVTENTNEGNDTIQTGVTYTLSANVENLTLTGGNAINGAGNSLNNVITGNYGNNILTGGAGNDILNGGSGTDTLSGGVGNDYYFIDDSLDVVTENTNEGIDTVETRVAYTLGNNVENLVLGSSAGAINGTGNALNNIITGNEYGNILNGAAGADTLRGGLGDDTYVVDNAGDVVTENANEGTDTVQSAVSYTLGANLENLTLTGTAAINGTGNSLNNNLTGNSGANILTGGLGDDTYVVGSGDTVVENANAGIDTVQSAIAWTLGANLENLTLTGTGKINGTGNSLNNVIIGNTGINALTGGAGDDTLNGGGGTDTLAGGTGNDTYIVNATGVTITENANEGTDTVQSAIAYTLGNNLENLLLTGTAVISGTGNTLNNVITGNANDNTLNGAAGADTLMGGTGNDTYVVDNAGDVIIENANEGTDTVQTAVTYTLSANVENLTLTGTTAINGTGNTLNNTLTGNSAANMLTGGAGDDAYIVGAGDTTIENANEGIDTVQSAITWTLSANVENLTLTGATAINGTGNSLNNVLTGNSAANVLTGGAGDDTYVIGTGDTVVENANEGIDTVQSAIAYTLGANLDNLTLTGTTAINGTGNSLNNVLIGNSAVNTLTGGAGDDTLNGGGGADILIGGTSNDRYIVDASGVTITENANEGLDSVQSSVTFTLAANLENLTLTGAAAINGTGNTLNNVLTGNAANNVLDGGAGADQMIGGLGDDTYVIDNVGDVIVENVGEGNDTVQSYMSFAVGNNIENVTLLGAGAIDVTGDAGDNLLIGNSAANRITGGAGNDTLNGGGGTDTLIGGFGNDTYLVDAAGATIVENANEGTDLVKASVSATLAANVENLTLTGTAAINGTGNDLNNILTGNAAANVLDGGAGTDTLYGNDGDDTLYGDAGDTLYGGNGNDTYVVREQGALVNGNTSGDVGIDTVQVAFTYSLANTLGTYNVENLTLTGSANITGTGNDLNNVITGNSGANILYGLNGNDTLNGGAGDDQLIGGAGSDTMAGGTGDDNYQVDNTGDVVTENANEGTDTVTSLITYTLGANVENLTLTASSAINGTGNASNNVLTGNSAANTLTGGAGDDTLNGNGGTDTLIGGTGNDTYIINTTGATITENLNEGADTVQSAISYTLGANLENLTLTAYYTSTTGTGNASNNVLKADGNYSANTLTGGLGDDTYILDTQDTVIENANEGTDTVQAIGDYTLGANVENLTLIGSAINGMGNTLNNVITGNAQNNTLDGGAGNDTMAGGLGDDTYGVDSAGDVVNENANEGIDTVLSAITYTLGANVENLTLTGTAAINGAGNTLNNVLTGNSAANVLAGGLGDDTYIVDANDTVVENANEGIDTVQTATAYTLGANLENLTLTGANAINGTGNSLNNVLTGNSGANVLAGGLGNDTYVIGYGDTVVENGNEGIDSVLSAVDYTLTANVENLTLTSFAYGATGNSLDNGLTGNGYNNRLDGGAGADTMQGGAGDDLYIVDNAGDGIVENANEGVDTVEATVNYTLQSNVENLTLTGAAAINGAGNSANNTLMGNSAANTLTGGAGDDSLNGNGGADTLMGGTGNDTYLVNNAGITITENLNEGLDTVLSSITYTLSANIENLTLTGGAAINGTGNTLNNLLMGNSAANVLAGGLGDDTYVMGAGDTIVENANEGIDTVQTAIDTTLQANVENLTLTGSAAITGTGNSLDNLLVGNNAVNTLIGDAGNDTLDGGAGADVMIGGIGDDIYVIDNAGDAVVENADEGVDTIKSAISYALSDVLENLTLTGANAINATGNASNNILTGNSANNTLDGQAGADTMAGGLGDDTYFVEDAGDVVIENASQGIDTVIASIDYTLTDHVENLTLNSPSAISAMGNASNNVLTGNTADNILIGNAGDDTLNGGAGSDTMTGGAGNDTYYVDNVGDQVIENANEGMDTVLSAISYTLGADIESLTLTAFAATNGIGNNLNNVITGSGGDNFLDGGAGADTLIGGAGNDTYIVDNVGDTVVENYTSDGIDTVSSSVSFALQANVDNLTLTGAETISGTGNALDNALIGNAASNTLTGGDGNDFIDGAAGADTLIGGIGNDTYVMDDAGDTIIENAVEGNDTVQSSVSYALAANVENVVLTGANAINATGNAANNVLVGNSGDNVLDGATGDDTLMGGAGNDTYVLDSVYDWVGEYQNQGIDTVHASFTYALGANLENLILTGATAANGTDNALNNVLVGNGADNVLNATAGNDVLLGNAGNDALTDTTGNNLLFGGAGNDALTGGAGNEVLIGGVGSDAIAAGSGADVIAFNRGDGADTVTAGGGQDNTLSLGGGIRYQDLTFAKNGNDLILNTGAAENITLANWYAAPANHSVLNLQVIAEAMAEFDATSSNPLLDNKVETFNFAGLVDRFDAARAADGGISQWALTDALLDFHLSGSDDAALGGDLAYQYGKTGALATVGSTGAQNVLSDGQFGSGSQTFQSVAGLQEGVVKLG